MVSIPSKSKQETLALLKLEGIILVFIALICLSLGRLSFLEGGLACYIPKLCFAGISFRHSGALQAAAIVFDFYFGQLVKIAITITIFAISFKYLHPTPLPYFIGYMVDANMIWLLPFAWKFMYKIFIKKGNV